MSSRPTSGKGPQPHLSELPLVRVLPEPVMGPAPGSLSSSPLPRLELPLKTCSHGPHLNTNTPKGTSPVLHALCK